MLRSLAIPGWGQAHNGAWLKAALVAGTEGWLGSRVVADQIELRRISDRVDAAQAASDAQGYVQAVNEYNARLDASVGRQWLLAGAITLALVDAYVDAHFRGFDIEFQTDPALPDGVPAFPPPTSGRGEGTGPSARIALRWTF